MMLQNLGLYTCICIWDFGPVRVYVYEFPDFESYTYVINVCCGASWIGGDFVLTAAHCQYHMTAQGLDVNTIAVGYVSNKDMHTTRTHEPKMIQYV